MDSDEINTGNPLSEHQAQRYIEIVGELRYLAGKTRFDIYTITNRLSRACKIRTRIHLCNLKCFMRYLTGSTVYGMKYNTIRNSNATLRSSSDADYGNDSERRSYSGTIRTLRSSPTLLALIETIYFRFVHPRSSIYTTVNCDPKSSMDSKAPIFSDKKRTLSYHPPRRQPSRDKHCNEQNKTQKTQIFRDQGTPFNLQRPKQTDTIITYTDG